MPELRKDPIIGRWVIISTERGKRPSDFGVSMEKKSTKLCPFCPGNESATPPEVLAFRPDGSQKNTPGWTLRVISNKFPALKIEGDLNRQGHGIFDKMNGIGAHEVIIETSDHHKDFPNYSDRTAQDVIWAYRMRISDLKKDPRFRYTMVFRNYGEAAGASLEHAHSQLIATPIVPKRVSEELEGSKKYYGFKERCIFCDIVRQEISDGDRVISYNDNFIALEPFAPRLPFETWILPTEHYSALEDIPEKAIPDLASLLKETLKRLEISLNNAPYNYIMHTRPVDDEGIEYYHWHIEIMPKLTKVAGFEWGTGFYINPTAPEDAAKYLREVDFTHEEQRVIKQQIL
ncbi:MAG: galactose-1-phosphate uridylyltransferase [candidate division Zixibacteria bacterium]|nr:galactose-1-phosphate uridylyltransferase [candidate division Zixibacteria bacterium]